VRWFAGDLSRRHSWQLSEFDRGLLYRCAEQRYSHRFGAPLLIHGDQPLALGAQIPPAETRQAIEVRHTGKVTDVDLPQRTIELVVVPYDETTLVECRGRMVRESVAPGAFDGIDTRARVRVNFGHRDDELRHLLGHSVSFDASRREGLVSVIHIRRGEHGDQALELAEEGDLGASGGFGVLANGETWPDRSTRRLTRLFLDHIALTPTPAYAGAKVLSVVRAGNAA
jgi:HK97 family phage prohead protease